MQVNKIDNTNFGMALKIDKGLRTELKSRPKEFLKILDNLGEEISDLKIYHVCFEEGKGFNTPTIRRKKTGREIDYFSALKGEENNLGKYYEAPAGMVGETVGGFYPNEPRIFKQLYGDKAAKKYKKFKALDIYSQAAEYSRMLEKIRTKRLIQEAKNSSEKRINELIQQAKRLKHEKMIDEIFNKYQNDVVCVVKDEKSQTKGFFNKLINMFK